MANITLPTTLPADVERVVPTDSVDGFILHGRTTDLVGSNATVVNNEYILILNSGPDEIYVHRLDGTKFHNKGISLPSANSFGRGIAYVPGTDYILTSDASGDKIFCYSLAGILNKEVIRYTDIEFDLDAANNTPSGLVTDGESIWVGDNTDTLIYAYDFDGTYRSAGNINLVSANGIIGDMEIIGANIAVLDTTDDAIYIYAIDDGSSPSGSPYSLASANTNPQFITATDDLVLVGDSVDFLMYGYNKTTFAAIANSNVPLGLDKRVAIAVYATTAGTAALRTIEGGELSKITPVPATTYVPIACTAWRSTSNTFTGTPEFYVAFAGGQGIYNDAARRG